MGRIVPRPVSQLLPGDHILIRYGTYWHHGIYVGDGEVVHKTAGDSTFAAAFFSTNASVFDPGGGIRRIELGSFWPKGAEDRSTVMVVEYGKGGCFRREETVSLALQALESTPHSPYRLLQANCEHFAVSCKTGEDVSLQVLFVRGVISHALAFFAASIASISALARLDLGRRTTTTHVVEREGGVKGLLGFDKRHTLTTSQVDTKRVVSGGLVAGAAVGGTLALLGRLRKALQWRRWHFLACSVGGEVGSAERSGGGGGGVAVVRLRGVRTLNSLLRRLGEALPGAGAANGLEAGTNSQEGEVTGVARVEVWEEGQWMVLADDAAVKGLLMCASVRVHVVRGAGKGAGERLLSDDRCSKL